MNSLTLFGNNFPQLNPVEADWLMKVRPVIVCRDGATISIQASWSHYCLPRDNTGPYTHVEVGYPSHDWPEAEQWHDGDGIYSCVPVQVAYNYITQHGGFSHFQKHGRRCTADGTFIHEDKPAKPDPIRYNINGIL